MYKKNIIKINKQKQDEKNKSERVYFFCTNIRNQKAYTEQVDIKNKLYNIQDKQNTKYEL